MADNRELWEIQLDLKLKSGQEKYEDLIAKAQDKERLANKDRRMWEEALREDKKRTQQLENSYVKQQLANIDRLAQKQKEYEDRVTKSATEKLKNATKQNIFDSQFTGQTSGISNYGVSELKGQVGSAAYVAQLKALRNELSPTSAEFKQLSATITQYESVLNKVNKSTGLASWKQLNTSIKEVRGELARLTAEGKVGGAEWDKYSQKLRELVRQKQLVTRETKLTSQQLLAMSRDFTVVSFGVRQIITDIQGLSEGKKSAGELAMAISGIGLQTLTILPAIHSLNKALQAAGIISEATIVKLKNMVKVMGTMAASLGILVGGIAAVTTAYGLMAGAATHATDIFGRLGSVLSGQMSYWDALKMNINDVTFGLIDLSDEAENAANSLEYLLSLSVASGKQFQNIIDLQNYQAKFMKGGEFYDKYDPEEVKSLIENYKQLQNVQTEYEQEQERLDQYNKNKTDLFYQESQKKDKKGGSPRTNSLKEEKNAADELIKRLQLMYEYRRVTQNLSLQFLSDQRKELLAQIDINTAYADKNKLLGEAEKLQGKITSWLLAGSKPINDFQPQTIPYQRGLMPKKRFGTGYDPMNDPDNTAADIQALLDAEIKKEEDSLSFANGMYANFKGMLQDTELMKGSFGQVITMIDSLINGGSKAFGFFTSLLSLIPGVGPVASVVGTLSGGGGGMGFNGGEMPRIGSNPLLSPRQNVRSYTIPNSPKVIQLTLNNPVTFEKAFEATSNDRELRLEVVNG